MLYIINIINACIKKNMPKQFRFTEQIYINHFLCCIVVFFLIVLLKCIVWSLCFIPLNIQFPNTSTAPVMPYKNKTGCFHKNETMLTKVSCHSIHLWQDKHTQNPDQKSRGLSICISLDLVVLHPKDEVSIRVKYSPKTR